MTLLCTSHSIRRSISAMDLNPQGCIVPMATPTERLFHITTDDGTQLAGAVRTAGVTRPALIVHGAAPAVLGERLARVGLSVVTLSEGDGATPAHVVAALKSGSLGVRPKTIGLLGIGEGAAGAIRYAAADTAVGALVTWEAPCEVAGLDLLAAAAAVRAPWLIVHGGADRIVPPGAAAALHGAAQVEPRECLIIPDAGHDLAGSPGLTKALTATAAWLARHLT